MNNKKRKVFVTVSILWLILFILPLPPLAGIRLRLYTMMFYGGVTDFVVTPSRDRFLVSYGSIYAACPQSYNYALCCKPAHDDDSQIYESEWYAGLYVMNATSFRVVKFGIVGQTKTGYYIINTAKRMVYINLKQTEWRKMLTQMGVPADVKCHPLPLRIDYASRGWLRYQP